jgi:membrane protease YdiL (CAAX protease family)
MIASMFPSTTRSEILKAIALYYAIACGFAWLAWLPLVLGPDGLKLHKHPISLPVSACIGTLGPCLGCYIAHRVQTGNWQAVHLLPQFGRKLVWLIAGPLLILFAWFAIFPAIISKGSPESWHWHFAALAGLWPSMFDYNLFGGPLFEEFGWRGFLQPRLQQLLPPWAATICVGILWAAWHLPLFLVPWTSASPLVFAFILIPLAFVMAFAFNGSRGAVVVAILMHSAFNSSPSLLGAYMANATTRQHPSGEVFVGLAFLVIALPISILTRGQLLAPKSASRAPESIDAQHLIETGE